MTLLSSGEQVQFHEANEGDSERRRGLQGVLNQTHCLTYSVREVCCCSLHALYLCPRVLPCSCCGQATDIALPAQFPFLWENWRVRNTAKEEWKKDAASLLGAK